MKRHLRKLVLFTAIFAAGYAAEGSSYAFDPNDYSDYVYDANDFATEWVNYDPNGTFEDWLSEELMDEPENVLGRPTIDTTGDDWYFPEYEYGPVNAVWPAFRSFELLYLGEEGYVIVKFSHVVRDDENNPYGMDFIVFGNAKHVIGGDQGWVNRDPGNVTVGFSGDIDPGIVSVSQDGERWYSFTNDPCFMSGDPCFIKLAADANDGPFCDDFAPTLGRVYDPNDPDGSLGEWNEWWGEATNPTLPVDPNFYFDSFGGYTIAEISEVYGNSAGGTGYDIGRLDLPVDPFSGLKWFQYVRVDDRANGGVAVVDAFSDVSSCGDYKHPYPAVDFTKDCVVNIDDLQEFARGWVIDYNIEDIGELAEGWGQCSWDCN
jgi:hypothetical protein